jgi:hypothetical protein
MPLTISTLRDDFNDASIAPTWAAYPYASGSASRSESGGQAVISLPSSTAGTHENAYYSAAPYNLTGDSAYINIGTMVATGVAAYAFFSLFLDASNQIAWKQQSNTIKAIKIVGGVQTDLFSATWSSTTYKYLRIRESGGNVLFDSSTNGTSWTNRATTAAPFAVTSLYIGIGAGCGNVASPGNFAVDDFNLILPALSSTWRWTQVEWPLLYRFRSITLAATAGVGYIATSNDGSTWRYFAGPLGSASGGYNQLVEYGTQAAAQNMAVNLPSNDRWDLPDIIECRYIRLYHRSNTGATYTIREYYPRRLVQSDDIEAESIKAINIAASSITADKLFVTQLSAITANIGGLTIDTTGYLWQGTGTAASPTTGLKIYNSGGVGKLSTYNSGVEQITIDTDGKLKAGAGAVRLDSGGLSIKTVGTLDPVVDPAAIKWVSSTGGMYGYMLTYTGLGEGLVEIGALHNAASAGFASNYIQINSGGTMSLTATTISINGDSNVTGGLNVGTATGAATGEIRASKALKITADSSFSSGDGPKFYRQSDLGAVVQGYAGSSHNFSLITPTGTRLIENPVGTNDLKFHGSGAGGLAFFNGTATTKQTVTGSRGGNAALASLLTALAAYGLITNSSSA